MPAGRGGAATRRNRRDERRRAGFAGFRGGKVGTPSPWRTAGAKRRHDSSQTSRKCALSSSLCSVAVHADRSVHSSGYGESGSGRVVSDTHPPHCNQPVHTAPCRRRSPVLLRRSLLRSGPLQCMPFTQFTSVGAVRRGSGEARDFARRCCCRLGQFSSVSRGLPSHLTLRAPTAFTPRAFVGDSPRNARDVRPSPALQSGDAVNTARRGVRPRRTPLRGSRGD